MEKQKYVAYLRQSTKKQQNSGLGVEAQREIIQKYLKDTIPISEYIETESGKTGLNFQKLWENVEKQGLH